MPKNRVKDPIQENLRQHKRAWNAKYKEFAGKLKAFKNSINGKGDVKFSLPASDIKEPLPTEIITFLSQLTTDFQQLVSSADSISKEQESYSANRRKKQPKQNLPSQPVTKPTTNLENILSASEISLEKYSSNRISRFWQYFSSVFSSEKFKRHRIGMLSTSADLYYLILDFENAILSLGEKSIPNALNLFQNVKYTFEALKRSYVTLGEMAGSVVENKNNPPKNTNENSENENLPLPEKMSSGDQEVDKVEANLHLLFNAGIDQNKIASIYEIITDFKEETDPATKVIIKDRIRDIYSKFIKSIKQSVQKKYGPAELKSLEDVVNLVRKNSAQNNDLVKVAHNFVTRTLKKQVLKVLNSNRTAIHRLEIDSLIVVAIKSINKLMNLLEAGVDVVEISKEVKELESLIAKIAYPLGTLSVLYKEEYYNKHRRQKVKDKVEDDVFQDYVLKHKIRRDLRQEFM